VVPTVAEQNTDPEAWFADQLAQLQLNWPFDTVTEVSWDPGPDYGRRTTVLVPGTQSFEAVQKLAQEYGEMCAARALDGADVDVAYSTEMAPLPGRVKLESGKLVVRPK
jgi:hypothetical protein